MNGLIALQKILQRVFCLPALNLDATDRRPRVWVALLGGAGLGFIWGVGARIWMRLISTSPEFTISGTLAILLITTIFGAWAGLAFAARRRGWRRWGHYGPRSLAMLFFLPLGTGAGIILMLTVLLATLAVTQSALVGVWVLVLLMLPLGRLVGMESAGLLVGMGAVGLAVALTVWKWRARRRPGGPHAQLVDGWIDRIVRTLLLLCAAGGVGLVAWQIITDKPGWLAPLYILFYLGLLYPVFLALRVVLQQRQTA